MNLPSSRPVNKPPAGISDGFEYDVGDILPPEQALCATAYAHRIASNKNLAIISVPELERLYPGIDIELLQQHGTFIADGAQVRPGPRLLDAIRATVYPSPGSSTMHSRIPPHSGDGSSMPESEIVSAVEPQVMPSSERKCDHNAQLHTFPGDIPDGQDIIDEIDQLVRGAAPFEQVHRSWTFHLRTRHGKGVSLDGLALMVLAYVVGWYRPGPNGNKKFKGRHLEINRRRLAAELGVSEKTLDGALQRLYDDGLLFHYLKSKRKGGINLNNVLHVIPNLERLREITYPVTYDLDTGEMKRTLSATSLPVYEERDIPVHGETNSNKQPKSNTTDRPLTNFLPSTAESGSTPVVLRAIAPQHNGAEPAKAIDSPDQPVEEESELTGTAPCARAERVPAYGSIVRLDDHASEASMRASLLRSFMSFYTKVMSEGSNAAAPSTARALKAIYGPIRLCCDATKKELKAYVIRNAYERLHRRVGEEAGPTMLRAAALAVGCIHCVKDAHQFVHALGKLTANEATALEQGRLPAILPISTCDSHLIDKALIEQYRHLVHEKQLAPMMAVACDIQLTDDLYQLAMCLIAESRDGGSWNPEPFRHALAFACGSLRRFHDELFNWYGAGAPAKLREVWHYPVARKLLASQITS